MIINLCDILTHNLALPAYNITTMEKGEFTA